MGVCARATAQGLMFTLRQHPVLLGPANSVDVDRIGTVRATGELSRCRLNSNHLGRGVNSADICRIRQLTNCPRQGREVQEGRVRSFGRVFPRNACHAPAWRGFARHQPLALPPGKRREPCPLGASDVRVQPRPKALRGKGKAVHPREFNKWY